jgi:SAM-dependent methyltransferase
MKSPVAEQWIAVLKEETEGAPILNERTYRYYVATPRWWKQVYDLKQLAPSDRILEIGSGSGNQLLPLAMQGYVVTGLDCSPEVLARCEKITTALAQFYQRPLAVSLLLGDVTQILPTEQFALVFSFGVIEHFLDRAERLAVLRKMYAWTAPGGACVNCVPNGMHPWRRAMRENKLGGYNIPEIDYGMASLRAEMLEAGFATARVIPRDLFGYRLVCAPPRSLTWVFFRGLNLLFKIFPQRRLPLAFRERHAYILAVVARKAKR